MLRKQLELAKAANTNLIDFYWWLGCEIFNNQHKHRWGDSVVERLSLDLKKSFPEKSGFSPQNLWNIRKFYLEYKEIAILQQLVREIPWGHNLLILSKIQDVKAREYYLRSTRDLALSRNALHMLIKSNAYKNQMLTEKQHNFSNTLEKELAHKADQSMKDIYTLDFLGISKPIIESEMENKMVEKIKDVMIALGYGFTFIGNQYRIRQNNKDYYIDLLFYNRRTQSLIAMELKIGQFKPEYVGKMNFYLNLLDDFVKEPHENPSIGIILCSERDKFEVEYTLRDTNKPVGVAEFAITNNLPQELTSKLPDPKELEKQIRQELGEELEK